MLDTDWAEVMLRLIYMFDFQRLQRLGSEAITKINVHSNPSNSMDLSNLVCDQFE